MKLTRNKSLILKNQDKQLENSLTNSDILNQKYKKIVDILKIMIMKFVQFYHIKTYKMTIF